MASTILCSTINMIHHLDYLILKPSCSSSTSSPSSSNLCATDQQDLKKMKELLKGIQELLSDVDEQACNNGDAQSWLKELKSAVYNAEDILDDLDIELHQCGVEVCSLTPSLVFSIKEMIEKLDDISHRKESLSLSLRVGERFHLYVPNVDHSVVYGREDDRENLVEMLLSEGPDKFSVLPIVGVPGVGKTTFAQMVYNDSRVCEHFRARGWVHFAEDFDEMRLIRAVIESVTLTTCFSYGLDSLQGNLEYVLSGKRFFIVLDDFCSEKQSLWESLRVLLDVGLEGSKVVLITQDELLSELTQSTLFFHLECLPYDTSWLLFQHHAFDCMQTNVSQNLIAIGEKIVKKSSGVPLLVKMFGALLWSETNDMMWNSILGSNQTAFDIFSAVKLSFYQLPVPLQVCLKYCSLFLRNYLFKKDRLVHLWIAQGFVHPLDGKTLEETGFEYFDELFRRSFFQFSYMDQHTFVIHHLIHDFILSISEKECSILNCENICSIPKEACHLSMIPKDSHTVVEFQTLSEPTALRTFLIVNKFLVIKKPEHEWDFHYYLNNHLLHVSLPNDLFLMLQCLRALDLSDIGISSLPDSIGHLKSLRFLGLNKTNIRRLPASICKLHHLQTLELQDCLDLRELPKEIARLINLHHLEIPKSVRFVLLPCGIGKLTRLQTLPVFYVGRNIEHYVIIEMKHLENIKGELHIAGLHNVLNAEDAKEANLVGKQYIEKLTLEWSWKYDDLHSEGLDRWTLEDFMLHGVEVEESNVTAMLQEQYLGECKASVVSQDSDDTWIERIDVQARSVDPKKARKKTIWRNRKVTDFQDMVFEHLQPHQNVQELVILFYKGSSFPKWLGNSSFSKLVSITMKGCYNCKVLPPLGQLPSLKSLCIEDFVKVKRIGAEFYGDKSVCIVPFPSLQTLEFNGLRSCEGFNGVGLQQIASLQSLKIQNCPKLQFSAAQEIPPKLWHLEIVKCPLLIEWCHAHESSKLANIKQLILNKKGYYPFG
ncbi:putative disease resistance protein At3g14460 [Dioscorea cayenensis subsp. rotundata]|uniref:Disease resistance protein At3g14460 n=1 Tax=Dioscorea cayennensis subsp. rotundata TaxID=55577 RepID=A0AB40BQW8_DIOCR|nr:putative disease resistance protein At3g14460 [Dioscorea cayenensis subsp. rotundata]